MADGGFEQDITVTKLKLKSGEHIYVKTRWMQYDSLNITALNGLLAWSCHVSEQDVAERASAWGISVEEFMQMADSHLRMQDSMATYSFRALDSNWTRTSFSWTMAGRKVKLELKEEKDPAAINCDVFDHILEKIGRLKAEQAEAEVSLVHLASSHNYDPLQKDNTLTRLFAESQYTLTHLGPQNSQFCTEFNAPKPLRNPQKTFEFSSPKTVTSHVDHEIQPMETVSICGPRQASCISMKDPSLIIPSVFSLQGSRSSHLIEPPDTGIHCNKRPYSHCFQTTNCNQELTFNCNKRRGAIMEEQAWVCDQQCEGAQVILDDNIMRVLNRLTQQPAKVGAETVRCRDCVPTIFKLPRAPVKDSEAHTREISDASKTNIEVKKVVLRAEAVNLVDGLRGNVHNVAGFPHGVSHSNTKDDVIVVSDSDDDGQEDDRRYRLQSRERDRRVHEVQGTKKAGDESSEHRAGREEGTCANIGMWGKEDESVLGIVPIERYVPRSGGIGIVGPWSERQPLETLQKYERKLGIPEGGEAIKGAGAGAEEQHIDSSLKEGAFPSSFYFGFRGVRESTAGKWSTWLKEAKKEFQEGVSQECSGHRDTEGPKEPDELVKIASSGKGMVMTKANRFETLPLLKVDENHKISLKADVEALDLAHDAAYPAAKIPSNRINQQIHVNWTVQHKTDYLGRWISEGTVKSDIVKVKPVAEFTTEGKLEGNKKWEKVIQIEAEDVSEDGTEEVPHLGHTSGQKCRKGMANMVKPSQRDCNRSEKAQGVFQEHKKRGRPFSAAKQQQIAQPTTPNAGAHANVAARKLQSESSDDDASIIEVKLDKTLHQEFQDADFYKFEDDRMEERIKRDQIWALYDEVDDMPRTWVRITKVSRKPSFRAWFKWLEPLNLSLQEHQWQQTNGYSLSCGEFKDGRDGRCDTISIFSHQMVVTVLSNRHVQIYPNIGEVWAFHRTRNKSAADKSSEKGGDRSEKPHGRDFARESGFRLAEILSSCGRDRSPEVQALRKLSGFRTLWVLTQKTGIIAPKNMRYLSHRVPAHRMKFNKGINSRTSCWDIDPAAIPKSESKMT